MAIVQYWKREYKSCVVAVVLLPFVFFLMWSFAYTLALEPENDALNYSISVLAVILFMLGLVFFGLLGMDMFRDWGDSDEEDHDYLMRNGRMLYKTLVAFSITLLIWIVSDFMLIYRHWQTAGKVRLIYVFIAPIVVWCLLLYFYNRTKKDLKNFTNG